MNEKELLRWWQSRYPQWASVTAPLVRYSVHDVVQSPPLETVLRLAFVRSLWRDESIRMSNALSRLSNIYDCSAETVIEDLSQVEVIPLAEFVKRYPTQSQMSQATFSLFTAPSREVIQDVSEFNLRLAEFREVNQATIAAAVARVDGIYQNPALNDGESLTAKKQDDMCFQWSYYLAIADALEPERRKLIGLVKPDQEPHKIVSEKCNLFFTRLTELLEHARKNKPPHVLRTWIDEVEAWIQLSKAAFPNYKSASQVRSARNQKSRERFNLLLDKKSREQLASIGDSTIVDDGRFWIKVVYKKLEELTNDWAPMSLQVLLDRKAKQIEFADSDKARVTNTLQQFTSDILRLRTVALGYAREMNVEMLRKGQWVSAKHLTDEQVLRSVKKLTIQVVHPQPEFEDVVATLELDCDWDPEHGVHFGLLPNGQIELGIV